MPDKTLLQRMEDGLDQAIVDILERGFVQTDSEGNAVMGADNKPVTVPPPAAFLNMVRQRISDLKGKNPNPEDDDEMAKLIAQAQQDGGGIPALDREASDPATP